MHQDPAGLYENFWPATDASYIRPPFAMVKTAIPFWYPPAVAAPFWLLLLPAVEPVVPAEAPAEAWIATAPTEASKAKFPEVNLSKDSLSLKNIIWL
jgi:hypothetical protein